MGKLQVRETFSIPKMGTVAGCMVTEGKINRKAHLALIRDAIQVYEGKIGSLRRFKDDVSEVQHGFECGVMVAGWNEVKTGDIIEAYEIEIDCRRPWTARPEQAAGPAEAPRIVTVGIARGGPVHRGLALTLSRRSGWSRRGGVKDFPVRAEVQRVDCRSGRERCLAARGAGASPWSENDRRLRRRCARRGDPDSCVARLHRDWRKSASCRRSTTARHLVGADFTPLAGLGQGGTMSQRTERIAGEVRAVVGEVIVAPGDQGPARARRWSHHRHPRPNVGRPAARRGPFSPCTALGRGGSSSVCARGWIVRVATFVTRIGARAAPEADATP